MNGKVKAVFLLVAVILTMGAVGLQFLPTIVEAMPGRYRIRLSESVLALVTTPLPIALPAPVITAPPHITVPALATATFVPTPTLPPTNTPIPTQTNQPTATATIPPTDTPIPPTVTPTPTATPLPAQTILTDMKIIPQTFNNCGPTNLTMVLNYYGLDMTPATAAAYLKPNVEDRNVSPWQIGDYVNEFTEMRAIVRSGGSIELLKQLVAAGFPVVVEKGFEPDHGADGWMGHYLTVFGYDDAVQEFVSMDSFLGPWDNSGRRDSYETMHKYWQHFNFTFYVVYTPAQEETVRAILGETMWDDAGMWQQAALQAQADIEAEPNNAFAWFNLGTSLTRLGEMTGEGQYYENGAAAFDQARVLGTPPRMLWYQFRPYIAYMKVGRYDDMITLADVVLTTQGGRNVEETYLYKGHALLFLGQVGEAEVAYEQALALNENFYPAQWALDAIR